MRTEADQLGIAPLPPDSTPLAPAEVSFRQRELSNYFRAAHALRHGSNPEEAADDLCTIAYHTEWPLLRGRIHGVFK